MWHDSYTLTDMFLVERKDSMRAINIPFTYVMHWCVWYDSFICVTWHDFFMQRCLWASARIWCEPLNPRSYAWYIYVFDMTYSYVWRAMTHSHTQECLLASARIWYDTFICATWHDLFTHPGMSQCEHKDLIWLIHTHRNVPGRAQGSDASHQTLNRHSFCSSSSPVWRCCCRRRRRRRRAR